ncbi:MAG: hypothetical protein HY540_00910 [Deltaproteobacteria bacterium]|nr:hypothetical protein [Deltaproteobacteria bacterium]
MRSQPKTLFPLTLLILTGSCTANPGVSPGPPAEIPLTIAFATKVSVDASEVKTPSASLSAKAYTADQIKTTIQLGGDLAASVNSFADVVLAVFSNNIKVPTNPNFTQCQFDSTGASCNGTSISGSKINPIKMDFADFDLDGDGTKEGCSGSTCPINCNSVDYCETNADGTFECPTEAQSTSDLKPICVRLWVKSVDTGATDFARLLAMRLDRIPCTVTSGSTTCLSQTDIDATATSDRVQNPGRGAYRATFTSANQQENTSLGVATVDNARTVGVAYDHMDAATTPDVNKKSIDVNLKELKKLSSTQALLATTKTRSVVSQETVSSSVRKTVMEDNTFQDIYTAFGGNSFLEYVSRFLENGNYWSGTVHSSAGDIEFTSLCSRLTASGSDPIGTEVAQSFCTGDGVDVTGVSRPTYQESAATFPSTTVFPAAPTF